MFPNETFEFEWISTKSWVSDQPMSDEETYTWAYNRVQNARQLYPSASFWVWIEWGLEKQHHTLESFWWIIILRDDNKLSHSKTATLILPEKLEKLIHEWKELWEASDIVFWEKHSKCKTWTTGLLTWGIISRTEYSAHAIILALAVFTNDAY